jgi:hypothetical protein
MKKVLSVSLGTSARNKKAETEFLGVPFHVERVGVDGDAAKYRQMIRDMDGKIDCFGVGGMDVYLYAGAARYAFREPLDMMRDAIKTPWVDGSGLKHTLERETVAWLQDHDVVDFRNKKVLLVSAVDRFGMAEALSKRCGSIVFGDLLFGVGLPIPVRTWEGLQKLARAVLPIVVRLPFQWFYPTGEKQKENTPRFGGYFDEADIIAGDWHFIRRYAPQKLTGKIILTNTIRLADVDFLRERGAKLLITTTPEIGGESFATNVMEAVLVALLERKPSELTPQDYLGTLKQLGWKPRITPLDV